MFTVEAATSESPEGYAIQPHGRYNHGEAYVRRTVDAAGLRLTAIEEVALRNEAGTPVVGLLVTGRRDTVSS